MLLNETTLSLTDACKILPTGRNGSKPHIGTLTRWINDGVTTADGTNVRLEALRLGGKWVTSKEALQRFAERLTPGHQTTKRRELATTGI